MLDTAWALIRGILPLTLQAAYSRPNGYPAFLSALNLFSLRKSAVLLAYEPMIFARPTSCVGKT
jgi:hypothetical protein